MHDWWSFLRAADEWFVNYASVPADLSSVITFSIGHTVELYLKATYVKNTGDMHQAIKYGHKIRELWGACKSYDKNFMPNYEIRNCVFNADLFNTPTELREILSDDDLKHYFKHQELYLIAKLLPDLKYLGAPLKFLKGAYAFGYIHPNPYWIEFFKEFRSYLQHPSENRLDFIKHKLDEGDLPVRSIQYLRGLYT